MHTHTHTCKISRRQSWRRFCTTLKLIRPRTLKLLWWWKNICQLNHQWSWDNRWQIILIKILGTTFITWQLPSWTTSRCVFLQGGKETCWIIVLIQVNYIRRYYCLFGKNKSKNVASYEVMANERRIYHLNVSYKKNNMSATDDARNECLAYWWLLVKSRG